jgi:hypothetical protein
MAFAPTQPKGTCVVCEEPVFGIYRTKPETTVHEVGMVEEVHVGGGFCI